jgi:hypothetical protein
LAFEGHNSGAEKVVYRGRNKRQTDQISDIYKDGSNLTKISFRIPARFLQETNLISKTPQYRQKTLKNTCFQTREKAPTTAILNKQLRYQNSGYLNHLNFNTIRFI